MTTPLGEYLRIAVRRKVLIGASMGIAVGTAWLVASAKPPHYVAEAVLALDSRKVQIIETDAVVSRLPQDAAAFRTELDVLSSRSMAERVADRLDLVQDSGFLRELGLPRSSWRQILAILRPAKARDSLAEGSDQSGFDSEAAGEPAGDLKDDAQQPSISRIDAVDWLLGGLRVTNDGRSLTIGVSFQAQDPELAARIANSFAQSYLDDQLEMKLQATHDASAWLSQRLVDMRQKLETSEAAVQQFQHDAGLIETAGTTITGQQLVELNSQLIVARSERAQAESRTRMATELARTGGGGADLSDVLGSTAVQTLRTQLYEVQTKLDEQRNHWRGALQASSTTTLEAQKASLTRQINEEIARVVASLMNEARAAREKEAELEAALRAIESRFGESGVNVAHLNQLQREADANRTIYESFLKRYKETIEQVELATPDARLISSAEPPREPAGPKRLPILILGFIGGAGISAALALLLERLDNRVRRASELEEMTGAPVVGVLPRGNKKRIASEKELQSRSRSGLPCSQVSDALHQVQVALRLSRGGGSGPKVIMVISATLDESKAGFSSSLACSLASNGLRVLLIDINGRQADSRTLHDNEVRGSLADVIEGRLSLEEAVGIDPVSGVHVLSGVGEPLQGRLQRDLSGFRMVMNQARMDYDAVVVDTLTVAEAAVVGSLTDANLLLVRWGMTSRDVIRSGLRFLRLCDVAIDGVIMTDVDLQRYAQYNEIADNAPTFQPGLAPATPPVSPPSIIERAHARSRSATFSSNPPRSAESRAERDLPR
jgi:uncharacterized protein involved in exopolysaccharide biosynthesis/Mrp family chromosome partitioning ATPase